MESDSRSILVPIDFTEQSFIGLEQAQILAKASNSEIYLLHVVKETDPIWNLFPKEEKQEILQKLKKKLLNFANLLVGNANTKIKPIVEIGYIVDTILRMEEELKVGFIVMGTTTSDNIRKKIIGSNALRVVHEAKCPVITIKGKHYREYCKKIVLPLDLHKNTREKVSEAIAIAKLFKAEILAVSVSNSEDEFISGKLKKQLTQVEKFISSKKIKVKTEIIKNTNSDKNNTESIKEYINLNEGDLLVITTQDQSPFIEYFIGSFAIEMIHGINIPVMSIAPKLKRRLVFNPY